MLDDSAGNIFSTASTASYFLSGIPTTLGDTNMADNIMAAKNMAEFLKNRHILQCQASKILAAKNIGG